MNALADKVHKHARSAMQTVYASHTMAASSLHYYNTIMMQGILGEREFAFYRSCHVILN